jgi:hypothetical protein
MGLGLLAGGDWYAQKRRDERDASMTDRYLGLLGAKPGATMGPPEESGQLGYSGGRGLLANPNDFENQMQFAAGVAGMPRKQREMGLAMLQATMQHDQAVRQDRQWGQEFGLRQDQFRQGQANYEQTFQAGRDDAAATGGRWALGHNFQVGEAARQAAQWAADHQLRANADSRAAAEAAAANQAGQAGIAGMIGIPKLAAGYGWQQGPNGSVIAAPVPGTPDHSKGVEGLGALQGADALIGELLDTMQGKEVTRNGVKIRTGGVGTEAYGENAARMSMKRGQIISAVAKLRDMGVLQQGEMENLEEQLPSPAGWGSKLKKNSSIVASYDELRKQFRAKAARHIEANPWLVPALPPGFEMGGQAPTKPRPGIVAPVQPQGDY